MTEVIALTMTIMRDWQATGDWLMFSESRTQNPNGSDTIRGNCVLSRLKILG